MKITSGSSKGYAKVEDCGVLLVGLEGFTIEDLARLYPDVRIGLHVKDGDKWIPVEISSLGGKE